MDPDGLIGRFDALADDDRFARRLARALVGPVDADDVAQDAWLRTLERPDDAARATRPWLATVVRRLAFDLGRGRRRRREREEAAARPEAVSPVDRFSRKAELNRRLAAAVLALDRASAEVVVLRYVEGMPPRKIAALRGEPVETVKSRLKRALARLRARLDADFEGGRAAWLSALVPLARTHVTYGTVVGAVMSAGTKKLVAALFAVVVFLAWREAVHDRLPAGVPHPPAVGAAEGEPAAAAPPGATATTVRTAPFVDAADSREAVAAAPSATGDLVVDVRWSDGTPADGVVVLAHRGRHPFGSRRASADATGVARFLRLDPGPIDVTPDRGAGVAVTIKAGEERRVALKLERGWDVEGMVVDEEGRGVGGAEIFADRLPNWVSGPPSATTRGDGSFRLRAVGDGAICLHARAHGFGPGPGTPLSSEAPKEGVIAVRIVLSSKGGVVRGRVVTADGKPARAAVQVGKAPMSGRLGWCMGTEREPAAMVVESDDDGRFEVRGVAAGPTPVIARAPGLAPAAHVVETPVGGTVDVELVLTRGGVVRGKAQGLSGRRPGAVEVGVESHGLSEISVFTDADGSFQLEHVPLGPAHVVALLLETPFSRASADLEVKAETRWDPFFDSKGRIFGRLVDPEGKPLPRWGVRVSAEEAAETPRSGGALSGDDVTGEDGRFEIIGLEPTTFVLKGRPLDGGWRGEVLVARGVEVVGEERTWTVAPAVDSPAWVTGRLVAADGTPVAGARLDAWADAHELGGGAVTAVSTDPATGAFKLGPMSSGPWFVYSEHRVFARWATRLLLAPGETRDLGEIRLESPGTLRVSLRPVGAFGSVPDYLPAVVSYEKEPGAADPLGGETVFLRDGAAVSLLAPGAYRIRLWPYGDAMKPFAATSIAFTIRSGEETKVEIPLEPASSRVLKFSSQPGARAGSVIELTIRDANGALYYDAPIEGLGPMSRSWAIIGFRPGRYSVSARTPSGLTAEGVVEIPVDDKHSGATIVFPLR